MPAIEHDVTTSLSPDALNLQAQLSTLEERFGDLQEQLRCAQRLAGLGTMAAMLAHEINNLLTPVVSYAQYGLQKDDKDLMTTALEKTLAQVGRVTALSDSILGLASDGQEGPRPVALKPLVEEAVTCLCRDLSKDRITLTLEIDDELKVRTRANPLQQVVFNLVQNARQAMLGRSGRLTISARRRDDRHVELTVRDTGVGIPEEDLAHVFEPFFTTKRRADRPDKRGIGLGLAVCQNIVDELDGDIVVESTPNVGTTFTLTLPAGD